MKKIINLGILAHVDAGKTTATENILYFCGKTRKLGSVDRGNTVTDSSEIEKKRGISVFSSNADVEYGDYVINIIDTPGHTDFAGETERSILALDAAIIVVSAVEGIQSHTENIINTVIENRLPCIFFINKIDRSGSNVKKVLTELRELFGNVFTVLWTPKNEATKECDVVENPNFAEETAEILSEFSDDIMEKFLSEEKIEEKEFKNSLAEFCKRGSVFPVVC